MLKVRVLVWEFALSHGFSCREFLLDGYVMVRYLTRILRALCDIDVTVIVHASLVGVVDLPNVRLISVDSGQSLALLREVSSEHDVAFLIAPPVELAQAYRYVRCDVAGPSLKLVHALSRKDLTIRVAEMLGLPVPRYVIVRGPEDVARAVDTVGLPCVIKPVDSAGCHGVQIAHSEEDLFRAVQRIASESSIGVAMVMEYVRGTPVSCSLTVSRSGIITACLVNVQHIRQEGKYFTFCGVSSPAPNFISSVVLDTARRLVRELGDDLRGYINIDLVVSSGVPYLVEINPRISMSFVNMSYIYDAESLAHAILMRDVQPRVARQLTISLLKRSCVSIPESRVLEKISISGISEEYIVLESPLDFMGF